MTLPLQREVVAELEALRSIIEPHFNPDTAASGFPGTAPSTGHCAAVATIVYTRLGGELVSGLVGGLSHWFNRFTVAEGVIDVDITADQFDLDPVEIAEAGMLHPDTRVRSFSELRAETIERAARLASRSKLESTARELRHRLTVAGRGTS